MSTDVADSVGNSTFTTAIYFLAQQISTFRVGGINNLLEIISRSFSSSHLLILPYKCPQPPEESTVYSTQHSFCQYLMQSYTCVLNFIFILEGSVFEQRHYIKGMFRSALSACTFKILTTEKWGSFTDAFAFFDG